MSELKTYLGDSVYADFDGQMVILTTENGYGPSNTIYLEAEVVDAFEQYLKRLQQRINDYYEAATGGGQ